MIPLAVLFALIDALKLEIIDQVELPQADIRSAFGFGVLSGKLQILTEFRQRIDEQVEANAEQERKDDERRRE